MTQMWAIIAWRDR